MDGAGKLREKSASAEQCQPLGPTAVRDMFQDVEHVVRFPHQSRRRFYD